jgi:hypothetical protein
MKAECDDCSWAGDESELDETSNLIDRIEPGGIVPAGECPKCGALAYMKCPVCDGEGLVDFTDEEWSAMYGVPMSEYRFTGMEPETMKRCPECDGKGVLDLEDYGPHSWKDGV